MAPGRMCVIAFFGIALWVCLCLLGFVAWSQARRRTSKRLSSPRHAGSFPHAAPPAAPALGSHLAPLLAIPIEAGILLLLSLSTSGGSSGSALDTSLWAIASVIVLGVGWIYVWRRWEPR